MIRILHILNRITGDGPTRSLITLADSQRRLGLPYEHCIVTLAYEAYPLALVRAAQAGIQIKRAPSTHQLQLEISKADIVQLHVWNNPTIYGILRMQWPAARLLMHVRILGLHAPQVVTPQIATMADYCVTTARATITDTAISQQRHKMCIFSVSNFRRVASCEPAAHVGFNVGYIGTTNYGKLHRAFVSMSSAAHIPNVKFIVCGGIDPTLQRDIERSIDPTRFDVRGYIEDIASVLSICDVFGYPLNKDSYATSDKTLQDAMYTGVPPVIFADSALTQFVTHGQTGLVVNSAEAYTQALETLYHHPAERKRLGDNARRYARQTLSPSTVAQQFDDVYRAMLVRPKRNRCWSGISPSSSAAHRFIEAMGAAAPQFAQSMKMGNSAEHQAADTKIMQSSPLLVGGEGGIMQYRNTYPDDAWLRYWAGLILFAQARHEKANIEFRASVQLGVGQARVAPYLT